MMKRVVLTLSIFLFILIFTFTNVVYAEWQVNFPHEYCELKSKTDTQAILWCGEDVLFSSYGLYVSIPSDANITFINMYRSYDLSNMKYIIVIVLTVGGRNAIVVNLPPMREYSGVRVDAWNLTYYYDINNSVAMSNIVLTFNSWSTKGWEIPTDFPIVQLILKPANLSNAPSPSLPEWHDVGGWVNFFLYLLNEVAKAIPTALSIFASAVMYLLQISPFLLLIIPLHIIFSFIEDPSRGVNTINFYISLARKIIDLLVKIVHAIVDLLGHIIPF